MRTPAKRLAVLALGTQVIRGPQRPPFIVGRWIGESQCMGDHPACHNEHVIFQMDSVHTVIIVHGARIAGRDTVQMGGFDCRHQDALAVACAAGPAVWRFWVAQDSLRGSLTLADGSIMRRVRASRLATR